MAFAAPVFYPGNSHYYEAVPGNYDWEEARNLASSSIHMDMRGHLATLTTQAENDWVWYSLGMPQRYLLGGSDRATEGVWEWVTGETWEFEKWASTEPNSGYGEYDEDALSFDNIDMTGTWNDLPYIKDLWGPEDDFIYVHGYIVEYEPPVIPEPVSSILFIAGGVTLILRRFLPF